MAVTYAAGPLLAGDLTVAATSADYGTAPDRRRLYDFTDRILKISPLEAPFFTFLSKTNKHNAEDSLFRYLQDRTIAHLYMRDLLLAADVNGGSAVTADVVYTFKVDDGAASIDWLVKGDVLVFNSVYSAVGYSQVMVRVENEPLDMGVYTQFDGRIIGVSANITGYNILSDADKGQCISSSYREGTDSPDVVSSEIEDDYGYTQIFKTAWDLSETSMATVLRGYRAKWDEEGAKKATEHKLKIDRAFLFSMKARKNNINYTEGLIGEIIKNGTVQVTGTTDLTYTADKAFLRSVALSEFTFDLFLRDFQVYFQAGLGGSREVFSMGSPAVITHLNKLAGTDGFLHYSSRGTTSTATYQARSFVLGGNLENNKSGFGHELTTIKTVHGNAHIVSQPMFAGHARSLLVFVDLGNTAYRPLVGNGINRDTRLETNIQGNDHDGRKDQYLTEAGLEVGLPERNMLWSLEGL